MLGYRKFFAGKQAPRETQADPAGAVLDQSRPWPVEDAALDAADAILSGVPNIEACNEADEAAGRAEAARPVEAEAAAEVTMAGVGALPTGPGIAGLDQFDEAFYLRTHADVAAAVVRGDWHSGQMHHAIDGYRNGRVAWPEVDAAWYGAAYPMAARDIVNGCAADIADHYHRIGRHRGYLPAPGAARPDDPARTRSRFGGLWTDHGNALDLLAGREDLGFVSAEQAALLRQWITRGYVVLRGAVSEALLLAAAASVEQTFAGGVPAIFLAANTDGKMSVLDHPQNLAGAIDLHHYAAPVRDAIFAPMLLDMLHLLFERRVLASHTLAFREAPTHAGRQESAHAAFSLPMQFATAWIALDACDAGEGPVFTRPGSHRMAEYRFHGKFKSSQEAARAGYPQREIDLQLKENTTRIALQAEGLSLARESFDARPGDALLMAADLVHSGMAGGPQRTMKSIMVHYCPVDCAPSYFERKPAKLTAYEQGRAFYSSGYYG